MKVFHPNMRILVVDDMSIMRKIIRKRLVELGYKNIVDADNGLNAWNKLEDSVVTQREFEFIVSDWNMPVCSGIELLKKVRANPQFKKLPFLMITSESEQENVVTAIKEGVSSFILKPFTPEQLKAKIDQLVQKYNS